MDESNSLSEVEKLKSLLQSADLPANLHDKAAEQVVNVAFLPGIVSLELTIVHPRGRLTRRHPSG